MSGHRHKHSKQWKYCSRMEGSLVIERDKSERFWITQSEEPEEELGFPKQFLPKLKMKTPELPILAPDEA